MKKLLMLVPLYSRRKAGLLLALFCALLTVAAGVGLLGVSGWFLTGAALAGAGGAFNLFAPSAMVRGLSFLRIGARYADRVTGHAATLRLLSDLRATVFNALIRLTPRQLARWRGGDLVARMTGDVDALDTVFLFVLAPLVTAVLAGAALTLVLGYWIAAAGWVLAAALLLVCVGVPLWSVRAAHQHGVLAQESAAGLRAATLDAVEGHADLLALHAQAPTFEQFEELCRESAQARYAQARVAARGQWFLQLALGLSILAVLWFGLQALSRELISGPLLVGLLLAVMGVFEVAGPIMRGASRMGSAMSAAARISDVVQMQPDLTDPPILRELPSDGAISVEHVRFTYGTGSDSAHSGVLTDVNLYIEPGERVAIFGASGVGKSTLLHLLLRLEDPQAGRVTFGGCDVRECAQAQLHQRIVLLTQDAPVFLGTLRTNLLIGDPTANDDALWRVLQAARLADFVRQLPEGLDTWAGETGSSLSVGQARRLCLARALLSPAKVIVLDEPTAGLDAAAQAEFFSDLAHATQGRTVVLATHAALPAAAVHRSYLLQDGKLQNLVEHQDRCGFTTAARL